MTGAKMYWNWWLADPKCTETDLKKYKICLISGQLDAKFDLPTWKTRADNVARHKRPGLPVFFYHSDGGQADLNSVRVKRSFLHYFESQNFFKSYFIL